MPLFQPSNITPSSFAGIGGGTVASVDTVKVTWQVNGNVPMTAYKIAIFDTNNKSVYSSEIITTTAVYPTDNKGNPQYFTYEPNKTWGDLGCVDGNDYTLQITQYWGNKTDDTHSVTQFSQSAFNTRSLPSIVIKQSSGNVDFTTISSVYQDFTADYTQAQGDSIDWVRWKFYQVNENEDVLIDDTGAINTQVLLYTANNMQSGETYKLVCMVQTENGIQAEASVEYNVSYELPILDGNFKYNCLDKASNLLSWTVVYENVGDDILGVSNDNKYSYENGSLVLPQNSTVTWATKNGKELNLATPWSLVWKGSVDTALVHSKTENSISTSGKGIYGAVFSPNGTELTLWGYSRFITCSVGSTIYSENEITPSSNRVVYSVSYNSDGVRCVCGAFGAFIYKTRFSSGKQIAPYTTVETSSGSTVNYVKTVSNSAFNTPYGDILVISSGDLYFYRMEDGTATALDNGVSVEMESHENRSLAFSADGNYLFVAGTDSILFFYRKATSSGSQYVYGGSTSVEASYSSSEYYTIAVSPNNEYIIYGLKVYKFSITNSSLNLTEIGTVGKYYDICFTADSKFIIKGYLNRTQDVDIYKLSDDGISNIGGLYALGTDFNCIRVSPTDSTIVFGGGTVSAQVQYCFAKTEQKQGLISFGDFEVAFGNKLYLSNGENSLELPWKITNELVLTLLPSYIEEFSLYISPSECSFIYDGEIQTEKITNSATAQETITSIVLSGRQTCDYLYIENGTLMASLNLVPEWGVNTYFLTNFDLETLQAGQLEVAKPMMEIYRENVTTGEWEKLYSCNSSVRAIRDFSWITGNRYNYYGYLRLDNVYTSANLFNESIICRNQPYFLLLEATQDEEQTDAYHVVNYWRFGCNIESGSVSNNNAPNFLTNFTGYRLKQPTERKGKSGTLTALISNVTGGKYEDTVKQMEELYALSESENTLFLKDMKGNLYMVTVSGAITQTINTKSAFQEVKVSIPWEEIGSCEGISIIQIPTDEN